MSMLAPKNRLVVERIFEEQAHKFDVKIHALQNVGDHLHSIVSCGIRENFQNLLRAIAGLIATALLPDGSGKFWTKPPFTRLITGRRDYQIARKYLEKNRIEAEFGKMARLELEEREGVARRERTRQRRARTP